MIHFTDEVARIAVSVVNSSEFKDVLDLFRDWRLKKLESLGKTKPIDDLRILQGEIGMLDDLLHLFNHENLRRYFDEQRD